MTTSPHQATPVLALAGGVGAARFLSGLVRAVPPTNVTAVVNTGDDRFFYGAHVCPDLDIVTYTLAGRVDVERGYGLSGDSFGVIEALGSLGHETWFRLATATLPRVTIARCVCVWVRDWRRSPMKSGAPTAWKCGFCRCRRIRARRS